MSETGVIIRLMERAFPKFLVEFRKRRGLEAGELSVAVNRSRNYVTNLERSKQPPPREQCEALANVLKLSEKERARFFRAAAFERRHCDKWYAEILESEKRELENHLKLTAIKVKTKQTSVKEGKPMYRGVQFSADADKIWGLEIDDKGKIENGDFVLAVVYKPGDRSHESPDIYLAQYRTTMIPDQVLLIPLMRDAPPLTVTREDVELHLVLGAKIIE